MLTGCVTHTTRSALKIPPPVQPNQLREEHIPIVHPNPQWIVLQILSILNEGKIDYKAYPGRCGGIGVVFLVVFVRHIHHKVKVFSRKRVVWYGRWWVAVNWYGVKFAFDLSPIAGRLLNNGTRSFRLVVSKVNLDNVVGLPFALPRWGGRI